MTVNTANVDTREIKLTFLGLGTIREILNGIALKQLQVNDDEIGYNGTD